MATHSEDIMKMPYVTCERCGKPVEEISKETPEGWRFCPRTCKPGAVEKHEEVVARFKAFTAQKRAERKALRDGSAGADVITVRGGEIEIAPDES